MTLPANSALLALAAICAALAAVLLCEIATPVAAFTVADAPAAQGPALPGAPSPFVAPPLERFSAIDQRAVFDPARKAIAPPPAAGATLATPPPVSLVGVIIDANSRLALVKTPDLPMATGVKLGDSVDGWQVTVIEPERIVLHAGTTDDEIRLDANRGSSVDPAAPKQPQ